VSPGKRRLRARIRSPPHDACCSRRAPETLLVVNGDIIDEVSELRPGL